MLFVSCRNILRKQFPEYHPHKRLYEKDLGKERKWEVETYQF
jgi:hypothetical protein